MKLQQYFQSYENYFWEWENEIRTSDSVFEALVIPEGNTIAYEQFVMETLDLLAIDGFPPFGSLLLALIATNSNATESLTQVFEIINNSYTVKKEPTYPKGFTYAHNFLKTLADLPTEFKQGDKRKQLLQTIFKNCHNRVAAHTAQSIMLSYKEHKYLLVESARKLSLSDANLKKDLQTLAHLNIKYPTTETLLAAIANVPKLTELDQEIEDLEPIPASSDSFIDKLIEEPKTFLIGSLIQRIWSGLNIPLHHSTPSHQPLGGVSDLTNKGDFDKLLISEFANEDEIFMSRIANNEALYIKREVPPESDKFFRLLLIDCSLKNWGTPKILAFASALAIAKHPKTDIECKIVAMGNGYREIAYETIEDIIDGLDSLGTKLDVAPELSEILNENTDIKHSEVFLITSEEAMASADMRRVVSENHDKIKYIITAGTEGILNFDRLQNRGRKRIQHIELPLEELWTKKKSGKSKKSDKEIWKGDTLPETMYPILLPPPRKYMAVFPLPKDEFCLLTSTGMLFKTQVTIPDDEHYFRIHKGMELLLNNLSVKQNGDYALQINKNGEYILGAFYRKEMYLSILNLNTREYHQRKIALKGDANAYRLVEEGGFYCFSEVNNEYLHFYVDKDELMVDEVTQKRYLGQRFSDTQKRTKRFTQSFIDHNVLLNFMPMCITKDKQLQLNKHLLNINTLLPRIAAINLISNRNYVPAVEAVYEKMLNRFLFPDGSAVYRDGMGMLIFKSSNEEIPTIYMPTTLDIELAMATDTWFAGNKNYFKGEAEQKIITIEEFEKYYFAPFINTILNHGV
ncbi:hypothetical protein [Flavobacterium cerinum]|uniref:VWA domain-containing protein n=1 Tax=Flavobacterium cerinum TaxID=2502784 RepID=A0ABY5IU99_9FLAO|nr:hypothetical protein [Flavobacterium cerinum]UUC44914.1 hypothetical protein NOX80_14945 [Flavobacterium cerinum]